MQVTRSLARKIRKWLGLEKSQAKEGQLDNSRATEPHGAA